MRRALITGANRGMGRVVATRLASQGMETIWVGRDAQALDAARQGIPHSHTRVADLSRPGDVGELADWLESDGHIDVLVNNAAIYPPGDTLAGDAAAWDRVMQVNLLAPMVLTRAAVRGMVARGQGRVVMVSSGAGSHADGLPGPSAYAISKASLNAFTRKLASDMPDAVKVNAVCPGWVSTEMGGSAAPRSVEQGAEGIIWAATLPDDGPSGGFFRDGRRLPW